MRSELCARLMQIQLLVPKTQGHAAIVEGLSPHAQQLVEPNGRVDVLDRENKVIKGMNAHASNATEAWVCRAWAGCVPYAALMSQAPLKFPLGGSEARGRSAASAGECGTSTPLRQRIRRAD